MQDLRLVGVHDDGTHLLLEDADGTRLRLPLDDTLRAAVRQDRTRLGQLQIELDGGLRPRDVQTLIRAGASADEVAARAGWTVEKVGRYEGPILAERAHVADLARLVRMRTRASGSDAPTLAARVGERMRARDVDPATSTWDSFRGAEAEHWTVVMRFVAGGRERRALWSFEVSTQTVTALDDEARWLTEEEPPAATGPIPATAPVGRVQTTVYDVEAEGGVSAARRAGLDGPVDLVTAMRERSQARGRRSRRGRAPTDMPTPEPPADALPLAGLTYDPDVHGLPPAAHPRPEDTAPMPAGVTPPGADEGEPATPDGDSLATDEDGPRELPFTSTLATPEATAPEAAPEVVEAVEGGAAESEPAGQPPGEPATDDVDHGSETPDPEVEVEVDDEPEDVQPVAEGPRPAAPAPTPPPRPAARRGRPQVPSWDDIMFGSRRE